MRVGQKIYFDSFLTEEVNSKNLFYDTQVQVGDILKLFISWRVYMNLSHFSISSRV